MARWIIPYLRRQRHQIARQLLQTEGSAILEFAITVPVLVVFVVGIYDFSGAFNQKQKIEQAAQEGAIVAAAQPTSDIDPSNTNPDSLQAVATAVFNSLSGSGVIPPGASCGPPGTPLWISGLTWTYKITGCSSANLTDNLVITINRGWASPTSSQQRQRPTRTIPRPCTCAP